MFCSVRLIQIFRLYDVHNILDDRALTLRGPFKRMNPIYDYEEDMWLFSYDWLGDATKQEEELAEELRAGTFLENVLPNLTHLRTVTIDNPSIAAMSGPTRTAVPLSIPFHREFLNLHDGPLGNGPSPLLTRRNDGRARHAHGMQS